LLVVRFLCPVERAGLVDSDLVTPVVPDYPTITVYDTPNVVLELTSIRYVYGIAFLACFNYYGDRVLELQHA